MIVLQIYNEGIMVKDYRGTQVAHIPVNLDKTVAIKVEKYLKSRKVTIQGMEFWNVASCTWMGESEHPDIVEESGSSGYKLF